ncbi:MAG TPA: DUF4097 family beta strand repeat-containing protein [Kofleriaceae bacterium]
MKSFVILALLCAPAFANPTTEKSRLEVKPSGAPFKQLAIENPLGDVKVVGYDGTAIQIETVKHAPDDDTLDRLRVALVPENDGTVRIATSVDPAKEMKPVGRGAVRIDIVIHAPRAARIDAATAAGKLEIENLDAGAELDSTSGEITVKNVSGELLTHSVSGMTSLTQVFGSVDAATISSNVDLDSINGERLVASAHKGSIAGRRVRSREIELSTTDGRIQLETEFALRGRLVVSSVRGDITVQLRRATNAALRVKARGGKVDLGQPANLIERTAGWTVATLGRPSDPSAAVELQSKYGIVSLAVIQ